MKTTTKLWHMLIITLALLITACGSNSGSAGGGPVNWDYVACAAGLFDPITVPSERKEENLYVGQSVIKQGTVGSRGLRSFQFSLQESGTITVIGSSADEVNYLLSANDCTSFPLNGKVIKGPYYVIHTNSTYVDREYSLRIYLE